MPLDVSWPLPNLNQPSKIWQVGNRLIMPVIGSMVKVFHSWFNTVHVSRREVLLNAVDNRPSGVPLLTLCNHTSCMDDPFVWGMLDWRHLWSASVMRWSMAAHDICFTNEVHSRFFGIGKTVPVCRGEGVFQRGLDYCIELMNRGDWVHIFPEGRVNMMTSEFLRLKWGVGRLIAECAVSPIVVPFWHVGMDKVLPNKEPYRPQCKQIVTILIGRPLDFRELKIKMAASNTSSMEQRKTITDILEGELLELKIHAEHLHEVNLRKAGCSSGDRPTIPKKTVGQVVSLNNNESDPDIARIWEAESDSSDASSIVDPVYRPGVTTQRMRDPPQGRRSYPRFDPSPEHIRYDSRLPRGVRYLDPDDSFYETLYRNRPLHIVRRQNGDSGIHIPSTMSSSSDISFRPNETSSTSSTHNSDEASEQERNREQVSTR